MSEKITIKEIARRAQTSKTTVSFYLNGKTEKMSEDTKQRIEAVIKETNYRPSVAARSLNSKGTKLIGVIIGDITNAFANQIVKGIDDFARDKRYQLIVGNSNYILENEADYVNRMLAMGVDGFIIQPSSQFDQLIDTIKQEGKDVVFIDSQVSMDKEKWVKTNNYEAVLEMSEELIRKGYDEYIMITADPSVLSTRMERTTGFLDALHLNGKECITHVVDGDVESEELTVLLNKELKFGTRTLIFVANCFLLPRVYIALKNYRNLMPQTIGLIGFDNTEWSNFSSPTVTTIVQPAYDEGHQAAKILIDALEHHDEEAPNQILQCKINWGESTN
ncbi:LacI family DNA-binding transcriptional regulator [[Eubacterium] hominis]|uniref:LacI family DNA-binding transcriptional regulator n=1 Tax=[Eubacterium] hominis TaxID=2764325 RepID=UPI003A4DF1FB